MRGSAEEAKIVADVGAGRGRCHQHGGMWKYQLGGNLEMRLAELAEKGTSVTDRARQN